MRGRESTSSHDRGSVEFKSRVSSRPGDVMMIASGDVVTVPPTMTIMGVVKTMVTYGFRRMPVADAGTNRLVGIITSVDLIDFFGGGERVFRCALGSGILWFRSHWVLISFFKVVFRPTGWFRRSWVEKHHFRHHGGKALSYSLAVSALYVRGIDETERRGKCLIGVQIAGIQKVRVFGRLQR